MRQATVRIAGCDLDISPVPLRKVVKRGGTRANWKFCSRKMARTMIPTESSNEHAFLIRAELDPTITHVFAQAIEIRWRDNTGPRRHFPDFIVVRNARVEVHEVKPDDEAGTEEVKTTAAFARGYFFDRGATYGLALESKLKAEPTFGHAGQALYRLHDWLDERLARNVIAYVQDNGPVTIGSLVAALASKGCTPETALIMVAHNRLHVDYGHPLDDATVLHAGRGAWNEHSPLLPLPASGGAA
jgi:hypothetical protein